MTYDHSSSINRITRLIYPGTAEWVLRLREVKAAEIQEQVYNMSLRMACDYLVELEYGLKQNQA